MRGLVALLSPAAATPEHASTRRSPSPPLPRERGRAATAEKTGKETRCQAACRPSAFCSGALSGLGTRAGDQGWPPLSPHGQHLPGTGTEWLGWWDREGETSHLLPRVAAK